MVWEEFVILSVRLMLYYQIQSPILPCICFLQYAKSILHFRESLAINSLQVALWFNLGYAALHEEDWSLCATAYQRYCSLDPEVLSREPTDSGTDFADSLGNAEKCFPLARKLCEKCHLVHSQHICTSNNASIK
jgi:hypothetical protein